MKSALFDVIHRPDGKDNEKIIDNDTTAFDKRKIMGNYVKQLDRSMENEELMMRKHVDSKMQEFLFGCVNHLENCSRRVQPTINEAIVILNMV